MSRLSENLNIDEEFFHIGAKVVIRRLLFIEKAQNRLSSKLFDLKEGS